MGAGQDKQRAVIRMVNEINDKFLPQVTDNEYHSPAAMCMTCPKGKTGLEM